MRFYLFSFFLPFPKSSQSEPELHFELIVKAINIKMGDLQGKKAQYFGEIIATAELNSTHTGFHGVGSDSCPKQVSQKHTRVWHQPATYVFVKGSAALRL